jgi:hypothetical protein
MPPARMTATAGQAIVPQKDMLTPPKEIALKDLDTEESRYRDRMEKMFPSELQDRLEELKAQGQQALKERDSDRWLAVAMGGFAAAAGESPYALKNFAQGLGLTTKEMMGINKEFRKAEDLRNKAMREERKADRLERMGLEDKAFAIRQNADRHNLEAQKANQKAQSDFTQTKVYEKVNTERTAAELAKASATNTQTAELRRQALASQDMQRRAAIMQKVEEQFPQVQAMRAKALRGDLNPKEKEVLRRTEQAIGDMVRKRIGELGMPAENYAGSRGELKFLGYEK